MPSYRNEKFKPPGYRQMIYVHDMDRADLLNSYKRICSQLEGGGPDEPVAQGIRNEWRHRGWPVGVLIKIERNFKNIKRKSEW